MPPRSMQELFNSSRAMQKEAEAFEPGAVANDAAEPSVSTESGNQPRDPAREALDEIRRTLEMSPSIDSETEFIPKETRDAMLAKQRLLEEVAKKREEERTREHANRIRNRRPQRT